MGSPVSPLLANCYMAQFEQEALESSTHKPKVWYRYVDDTFVIWPHGMEKLQMFLEHLNSRHNNIKFTMELEDNGSLPFLDVLLTRTGGKLSHTVYRKPTNTNRYLNASSPTFLQRTRIR